ncbi:MAG: hypothetical protein M3313_07905, partial [Actinomycetota bacterium]|nr:hypothetical protein [Actinomycetota bacterium]
MAGFGPNEWLVEEMYRQYLSSPDSVDEAWHEFFADYSPLGADSSGNGDPPKNNGGGSAPAATEQGPGKASAQAAGMPSD